MAKKIKKLLAVVLAMVMCLGCFTVPAYATESETGKQFPINKTANGLDNNDQTDVTLTVPGTVEGDIDVVFILGGGMTANMESRRRRGCRRKQGCPCLPRSRPDTRGQ